MDEEKEEKKHFNMRKILEEKKKLNEKKSKKGKIQEDPEFNSSDNFEVLI